MIATVALLAAALLASPPAQGPWGVAYPPMDVRAPRPALVFLHGMWASPEDSCPAFQSAATPFGFLVCPRGNAPLGAGKMWVGTAADAGRARRAALDAAERLAPGKLAREGEGLSWASPTARTSRRSWRAQSRATGPASYSSP